MWLSHSKYYHLSNKNSYLRKILISLNLMLSLIPNSRSAWYCQPGQFLFEDRGKDKHLSYSYSTASHCLLAVQGATAGKENRKIKGTVKPFCYETPLYGSYLVLILFFWMFLQVTWKFSILVGDIGVMHFSGHF